MMIAYVVLQMCVSHSTKIYHSHDATNYFEANFPIFSYFDIRRSILALHFCRIK